VVERVLALLVRQRLVTAGHDTYMLSHEALIHAWDRLDSWLSEDRDGLRLHRELGDRARSWDRLGRDPGSLYGGAELELARRWVTNHPDQLDDLERDFYQAGLVAQAAQQRSRRRRSRVLTAVVISQAILLIAASIAGNFARQQYGVAVEERQSAEAAERVALSRQLAAQSASLADTNPNLAALLAVEAYRTAPSEAAISNLVTAANLPLSRRLTREGWALGMVFSPDGRTLAVRSEKGLRQLGSHGEVVGRALAQAHRRTGRSRQRRAGGGGQSGRPLRRHWQRRRHGRLVGRAHRRSRRRPRGAQGCGHSGSVRTARRYVADGE
jgi:hypothetical protein